MVPATVPNAYAGDMSVHDAWTLLQKDASAILIDVRTQEEWAQVGIPDLSSLKKEPIFLPWRTLPGMKPNASFESDLRNKLTDTDVPLLFLCKAGGRSADAANAMAKLGYSRCYNIAGGFEYAWQPHGFPWKK